MASISSTIYKDKVVFLVVIKKDLIKDNNFQLEKTSASEALHKNLDAILNRPKQVGRTNTNNQKKIGISNQHVQIKKKKKCFLNKKIKQYEVNGGLKNEEENDTNQNVFQSTKNYLPSNSSSDDAHSNLTDRSYNFLNSDQTYESKHNNFDNSKVYASNHTSNINEGKTKTPYSTYENTNDYQNSYHEYSSNFDFDSPTYAMHDQNTAQSQSQKSIQFSENSYANNSNHNYSSHIQYPNQSSHWDMDYNQCSKPNNLSEILHETNSLQQRTLQTYPSIDTPNTCSTIETSISSNEGFDDLVKNFNAEDFSTTNILDSHKNDVVYQYLE